MPNRIIKESACTSDSLALVSPSAERLFWRLVVRADDFGCYEARVNVIIGTCLTSMSSQVTQDEVEGWLQELVKEHMIETYNADGKRFLYFVNWDKHQKRRAKEPKYPLPLALASTCKQMPTPASEREQAPTNAVTSEQLPASAALIGNGIGNGIGIGNEIVNPPTPQRGQRARRPKDTDSYSEAFERFWSGYPRKIAKREAWSAWLKLLAASIAEEDLIATASRYAQAMRTEGRPVDKMLYAATFLGRKGRYEDYLPTVSSGEANGLHTSRTAPQEDPMQRWLRERNELLDGYPTQPPEGGAPPDA